MLKSVFHLKYSSRSHDIWFFDLNNGLIRKIRLISKFITSQPGKQTIATHILTNISASKGNQAMIFGQLIERNMINIFFWKIILKIRWRYYSKLSISWDQYSKASCSLVSQVEYYQNILKLTCRRLAFTSNKAFLISKRSGTSPPVSFSA